MIITAVLIKYVSLGEHRMDALQSLLSGEFSPVTKQQSRELLDARGARKALTEAVDGYMSDATVQALKKICLVIPLGSPVRGHPVRVENSIPE